MKLFSLEEVKNFLISLHPENFLTIAKKSGWLCPVCGSGSGKKGTGMSATHHENHTRFKCRSCGISGDILDFFAYTRYGIPFEAEQTERFKYGIIAACEEYGIESDELEKLKITYILPKKTHTIKKQIITKTTPTINNFWPTVDDIDYFLANRTPSDFTEQACKDWILYRGLDLWNGADKVLKQNLVGLIPKISSKFNALQYALDNEKKGIKIVDSYLVIKQQDIHGNTVGYKMLLLPYNSDGSVNDIAQSLGNGKLNTRAKKDGSQAVGYTFFDAPYKTTFYEQKQLIIIVESIANAIALSQLSIKTICIDSCTNEFIINDIKGYYQNLALWLDFDAQKKQQEYAEKYNLESILWIPEHCQDDKGNVIEKFDQNDLVRTPKFKYNIDDIINTYYLKQTSVFNITSANNINEAYCDTDGICNIIIANTGNGKTFMAEKKIREYSQNYERCLYATDTQENVVTVGNDTNSRIIISTSDEQGETDIDENQLNDEKNKFGVALTHARLSFYGDTGRIFEGILDKCNYPHKIVDEPQNLMQEIQIPFIASYYDSPYHGGDENVWVKQSNFVFLAYYSDEKQSEKYGKRTFKEKTSRSKQKQEDPNNIFTLTKEYNFIKSKYTTEQMQDPKYYTHLYGNVFAIDLEESINWNEIPKQRDSENEESISNIEYVKKIFQYLINPRIICEFPILKATEEPISRTQIKEMYEEEYNKRLEKYRKKNNYDEHYYIKEEIKAKFKTQALNILYTKIKSPKNPAYCPFLSGINILPWILLMRNKNSTLNLLSATFTKFNQNIIKRVATHMGWNFKITNVLENNFLFDVCTLQLKKQLTIENQKRLSVELSDRLKNEKLFIVTYKKKNADLIFNQIKILGNNKINEFCIYKHDFERIGEISTSYIGNEPKSKILHIITYCNSSLVQGVNLNEHSVILLDTGSFIATAALKLPNNCSTETKNIIMTELLKNEITQTIGRIFRARKDEIEEYIKNKKILKSKKKILIILHNMESLAGAFSVDENLTYSRKAFIENDKKYFISKKNEDDHAFQTLLQACIDAYNRKEPINQQKEDIKDEEDIEILKEKKLAEKVQKAIETALKYKLENPNATWRDISRKIHYSRFSDEEKEKIKTEYEHYEHNTK